MQEKSFFHDVLPINGQDWIGFDQNEYLKDTSKALVVALKKKIKTFYHFSRLYLHFPDFFPGLENCWANFKTFSRIQDSVWILSPLKWVWKSILLTAISLVDLNSFIIMEVYLSFNNNNYLSFVIHHVCRNFSIY